MSKNAEIIDRIPEFAGDVVLIEQSSVDAQPGVNTGQPYGLLLALTQP